MDLEEGKSKEPVHISAHSSLNGLFTRIHHLESLCVEIGEGPMEFIGNGDGAVTETTEAPPPPEPSLSAFLKELPSTLTVASNRLASIEVNLRDLLF